MTVEKEKVYVTCPRCKGLRTISIVRLGNDFTPSRGEFIKCLRCDGTGDVAIADA